MKTSALLLLLLAISLLALPPLTTEQTSRVDSLLSKNYPNVSASRLVPLVDTMISHGEYSDAKLLAQHLYPQNANTQNRFSLLMSIAGAALVEDDSLLIKAYIRSKNIKHYEMYYGSKAKNNEPLMALTDTLTRNVLYYITNDLWSNRRNAYDRHCSLFWSIGALEKRNTTRDSSFISTMNSITMELDTLLKIYMVDSTLSYSDNAVQLSRKSRATAFNTFDAQSFFPFEDEIARYAIEKDSLDITMGLFLVLAPILDDTTANKHWEDHYSSSRSLLSEKNIEENRLTNELLQERYELAEQLYARDSTSETVLYFMVRMLYGLGEYDKAFALSQKLTAMMNPKSERWFALMDDELSISYENEDLATAVAIFKEMSLQQPEQVKNSINYLVPSAYLSLKQPKEAYNYYYETIEITRWLNGRYMPWSLGSSLSWVSLLSRNFEQAKLIETHYDSSHFTQPSNDTVQIKLDSISYAMTLANIGHCFAEESNRKEALSYYKKAKKIFQRNHKLGKKGGVEYFKKCFVDDYAVMAEYGFACKKQNYFFRRLRIRKNRNTKK